MNMHVVSSERASQIKALNVAYSNDGKTPEQLVQENRKLVYSQANKLKTTLQDWETAEYDELVSAGLVGLCQAARRFDPSKGFRFSSLAVRWIRGEMLHYLRDRGKGLRVPRIWHDLYMRGYALPDEDAAAKNEITVEFWLEIKAACGVWVKQWDPAFDRSDEAPQDVSDETPHLDAAKLAIAQWLDQLPESDRQLVEAVYFEGKPRKSAKKRLLQVLEALPKLP